MPEELKGEFILSADDKNEKSSVSTTSRPEHSHTHNKSSFYSAFCEFPEGFRFSEQETDEEVLLILRRHFITNIPWLIGILTLSILPIIFPLIFQLFPIPLPADKILLLFTIFYYLIIFGLVLINFSLWYFHTGIVTTKRVIDIDLSGILFRQISEAKIRKIEEVTYKQVGFISSLFNYGDVYIQTAGEEINIEYDRVPKPAKIVDIINDLTAK